MFFFCIKWYFSYFVRCKFEKRGTFDNKLIKYIYKKIKKQGKIFYFFQIPILCNLHFNEIKEISFFLKCFFTFLYSLVYFLKHGIHGCVWVKSKAFDFHILSIVLYMCMYTLTFQFFAILDGAYSVTLYMLLFLKWLKKIRRSLLNPKNYSGWWLMCASFEPPWGWAIIDYTPKCLL